MSIQQNNIQTLEHAILSEARREARHILDDAREQADKIKQQAQKEIDAECEKIIQKAHEQAETLQSQAVATAHLEAQTLKSRRREQLLSNVFQAAQQKLQEVPQWPDYADIVRQLIVQAIEQMQAAELRVHADAATLEVIDYTVMLDVLSQELNVRLQKGEPLTKGTGIILDTPNGHRRYDNTLENRLSRIRDSLRTQVYHTLRGEKR